MTTIEEGYKYAKDTPSNCNEHIETLAEYAEKCTSIVEFGVKEMITTWGFLKGLRFNKKKKRNLVCVDMAEKPPHFDKVKELAAKNKIAMEFVHGRSEQVTIPKVDMISIDTEHHYAQLFRELEQHQAQVRKYIVILNTVVDGKYGEVVRMCYHFEMDNFKELGYEQRDVCRGLLPAIQDFLKAHPEWKEVKFAPNNNGLTILARVDDSTTKDEA
jgi:hypothetical protein